MYNLRLTLVEANNKNFISNTIAKIENQKKLTRA
jgi:hypothetical protein